MKPLSIILLMVVAQAAGCSSRPSVSVSSSLGRHGLHGKTLAVGGFTAQTVQDYPGQVAEETIVRDAGTALQHRFKHSRVLTAEATWATAGPPPTKINSGVPITLGHQLTRDFMRRTHAQGVDYLLWIDLMDNAVRNRSNQWLSTHTESSTCSCSKKKGTSCSQNSCSSSCRGSCCSRRTVTEYNRSESAWRSLGATYSLLDTASGKLVWRAESLFSKSNANYTTSESGYATPPRVPLPPEESAMMQRMTTAVIAELPN